ncbi:hypothetical protein OGAPHI_004960 [Ogataea philodendri]|uniref:CID domain-containing protein n=1 Tax=Ogataea philodendri TaxID=1378263 RepID=A0A9P8T2U8_9ASCO|nr:uncharacterized protein OGAPHI_004960 [Ogataea philodendri]KAH3663559.1 hypothetical protein OGAPHI_004960 [Ogataea philodendri]
MSFSVDRARVKLAALVPTQQSIQTTSQWIMFHYREAQTIVDLWHKEISSQQNKLTLFYLANDIVQLSRKDPKNSGFTNGFKEVLPKVIQTLNPGADKPKFLKVLQVWKDRNIYPADYVDNLIRSLGGQPGQQAEPRKHAAEPTAYQKCPAELIEVALQYDHLQQVSSANSARFAGLSETYSGTLKAENLPAPDVLIGQLEGLVKGSGSLIDSISSQKELREKLVTSLESLIQAQKDWINVDATKLSKLETIKSSADSRKRELEQTLQQGDDDEEMPTYKDDDEDIPAYQDDQPDQADNDATPAYESASDFISGFASDSKRDPPDSSDEPAPKRQEIPVNVDLNALLIFADMVKQHKLGAEITKIDSFGTHSYHVGQSPDERTVATCKLHKVPISHRAKQIKPQHFLEFDYVLCMDDYNLRSLQQKRPENSTAKVCLFGDWKQDDDLERIVDDPYYGDRDGFEECYRQCVHFSKNENGVGDAVVSLVDSPVLVSPGGTIGDALPFVSAVGNPVLTTEAYFNFGVVVLEAAGVKLAGHGFGELF